MKNVINYYYNLFINKFKRIDDCFIFEINNVNYEFMPLTLDIQLIEKIYYSLLNKGIYFHEIILNRENSLFTIYNDKAYVLIKKNIYTNEKLTYEDIIKYDVLINRQDFINWKDLWERKIDYYEYQISQLGVKYNILSETISYYIGLSECAINLLNYIEKKGINFYICHRRINNYATIDDLLNPLNIIFDNRTRDIGEFIKFTYINNDIDICDVYNYLDGLNLDYNESILLMARLIYPSYYFDLYDEIIQKKIDEAKIKIYTKKNVYYETFLKKIYKYIKVKYNIPEIEWLEI